MVKWTRNRALIFAVFILAPSIVCRAQFEAQMQNQAQSRGPSLQDWVNKAQASGLVQKALNQFPLQVVFVTGSSKGGAPEFLNLDKAQFDTLGLFSLARSQDILWSLRVSDGMRRSRAAGVRAKNENGRGAAEKTAAQLARLQSVSDVEILVHVPQMEGARWEIATSETGRTGGRIEAFEQDAPDVEGSASGIHAWLEVQLGFNGIVVDQSENRVLVFASKDTLESQSQAVFFEASSQARRIHSATARVSGLGKVLDHSGNFAIFESLLPVENFKVTPGSRIFIQVK